MKPKAEHHDPRLSIKMGRQYRRQTQQDLANELTQATGEPWSRVMVAKLEAGSKELTVETLMAIALVQDLPYSFYLEGPSVDRAKGRSLSSFSRSLQVQPALT